MNPLRVAIIGSGPAGLMCASQLALSSRPLEISIFEKRPGFGRKLLVAGASGLNISCEEMEDVSSAISAYSGLESSHWERIFQQFGLRHWIQFIESQLQTQTFLGTSGRYFVQEMKGAPMLTRWISFLKDKNVKFYAGKELSSLKTMDGRIELGFQGDPDSFVFDRVVLALGGGSWEEKEVAWPRLLADLGVEIVPFAPSNCGYHVSWNEDFLKESEGQPLKRIGVRTARGSKMGECVVTQYGIEGTPIYRVGESGTATLDLFPDKSEKEILELLQSVTENLAPARRIKKKLKICEASQSLLFHTLKGETDLQVWVKRMKSFPIQLGDPRPLSESISSKGGVSFNNLDESFAFKGLAGVYGAGEMLNWDAPTGGYLIQGCVSQGAWVAQHILNSFH